MGLFDGIKKFGSDVLAVGRQVAGGVLDAGKWVLGGAKTAITDPGKFIKDCGTNITTGVSEAVRHAGNSISSGVKTIGEGWQEAWEMKNPGRFLWKAVSGTAQAASLGVSDAIKEHVEDVSDVKYDELGNMTGFEVHEDADAITRVLLERGGKTAANVVNADNEIKEAIREGDTAKANHVFGQQFSSTVLKPVGTALGATALAIGTGVITVGSGGAALPAIAAIGTGAAGVMAGIQARKSEAEFDMENVAEDASDRSASMAKVMQDRYGLSEEQAANFKDMMQTYFQMAGYTQDGDQLGRNYGLEDNAAMKDFLAEGNGYDPNAVRAAEKEVLAAEASAAGRGLTEAVATDPAAAVHEGQSDGSADPAPRAGELAQDAQEGYSAGEYAYGM